MADEWDEFSDADPWNEFRDAPTSKKARVSQVQGFMKGVERTTGNMQSPLDLVFGRPEFDRQVHDRTKAKIAASEAAGTESGWLGDTVGSLVASAPTMFVGGPMTSGALQGFVSSDSDNLAGKVGDAALGALGGKVGEKVLRGASSFFRPSTEAAKVLRQADVPLTPGQSRGGRVMRLEDKMMSRPVVGEVIRADREASLMGFNRGALNKALEPVGVKIPDHIPTGSDAVAYAQDALGKVYDTIVPQISVKIDPRFVAGMRSVAKRASILPEQQQNQLQAIIGNIQFGQGGSLAGARAKAAQSELSRLGSGYRSSAVESERQLGQVLGDLKGELDDLILRQNPKVAPILQRVNKAWKGLAIVEDAASRGDDGLFSTGQLKGAVRRADPTRRKRATAAGRAYMQEYSNAGRAALPPQVPNSGTADRLLQGNLLAKVQGAIDLATYNGRKATTNLLAAHPGVAGPVSEFFDRLADPFGRTTGTAVAHRPR